MDKDDPMPDAATQIRRLFLERKNTYTSPEAAEILGMNLDDVLGWLEVWKALTPATASSSPGTN